MDGRLRKVIPSRFSTMLMMSAPMPTKSPESEMNSIGGNSVLKRIVNFSGLWSSQLRSSAVISIDGWASTSVAITETMAMAISKISTGSSLIGFLTAYSAVMISILIRSQILTEIRSS